MKNGKDPHYLVARYTGSAKHLPVGYSNEIFSDASIQTMEKRENQILFEFPVYGIRNSLISITAAADDLKFIVHTSPGEIKKTEICTFNNASCGSFVALTSRGYLHAQIKNTGYIPAEYTISVIDPFESRPRDVFLGDKL